MAHLFFLPPPIPSPGSYSRENERHKRPDDMLSSRSTSVSSNGSNASTPSPSSPISHNSSALSAYRNPSVFSTRSIPGSSAVIINRETPPSDDDVIIVTVKLSNTFRRSSLAGAEELPERPPARGFWRRMTTRVNERWDHTAEKEEKYKAVKMPRGEYKRFFKRDAEGRYVGTEQEREWNEEELGREFGRWQDLPLRSVVC